MSGACSTHGECEKCVQISVRNPEGKRPLGRRGRRWEDIKTNLKEVVEGCELDLSGSRQRLVVGFL
jgi:hypothetical protein